MKTNIEVSSQAAKQRADTYLAQTLRLSRNNVKRLLASGAIRSNGRTIAKNQTLEPGTVLEVDLTLAQTQLVPNPSLPLHVLFEDETLLVLDKPAALPCYPLRGDETHTLANALVARYPTQTAASLNPLEAGLCHRLDKETSGLLIAARNLHAYRLVRKAFSKQLIYKRYLCLCVGTLPHEGSISSPLVQKGPRSKIAPLHAPKARPAQTQFRVLEKHGLYHLLSVEIRTGVMHQIRAHLASLNAPLLGDERYGLGKSPLCPRLFLHAAELCFSHPLSGQCLSFEATLPPELLSTLSMLKFGFPRPVSL
ncbi:MAG: RluA family pseudouridine synthase [Proteobacteria bacterium]|nr:RluA family pseudouridine synthase [Cystobacterineae bacterium]MCL2315421.1 RluA family pseudouridine synthase [Pseudomonadota bacterium]